MSALLIVESPKKAKQIQAYLGSSFTVLASYGHVRDLPPTGEEQGELTVGVGADFSARYVVAEKSAATVKKLREAAKSAERVILATDPDREGEAIAWHLQELLRARRVERVTYTEVTERAIRAALGKPRAIDMNLVHAQEARRILDRLVGYPVSSALSRQAGRPMSAGRVQTPAVRLVVEREAQIREFKRRKHFGVELTFAGGWRAQWAVKPHLQPGEKLWLDEAIATQIAAIRSVRVVTFDAGEAREAPAAPFTTSGMQQEASKRLGWKVKEVMAAAQALFDSGHITYHRTDSPNFSEEGQAELRAFAERAGLPVAKQPRHWKAKAGAQEGHEATRPTRIEVEEAGDTDNEKALYKLIRARSLASVLADAVYATRTATLEAVDSPAIANAVPTFEAKGRVLVSKGWRTVYGGDAQDEGEDPSEQDAELNNPIPALVAGQGLVAEEGRRLDKSTEPPRRFTEAALVKELENRGIGRPSTFEAIVSRIVTIGYVAFDDKKGKFLVPTKIGEAVVAALAGKCKFADLDFTAGIEQELDQVAGGSRPHTSVIRTAWKQLEGELPALELQAGEPEHPCPSCGKAMMRRRGANGFFWGCTAYPHCRTSLPDNRGKPGAREPASEEHHCAEPGCGKPLVRRRKAGKGGYDFYGCTGYPTCKASYETGKDGKPLISERKARS